MKKKKNPLLLINVNAKLKILSKHILKILSEILAWQKLEDRSSVWILSSE